MEIKKVIVDGEEIEVAIKLDNDYFEKNYDEDELENTLELEKIEEDTYG